MEQLTRVTAATVDVLRALRSEGPDTWGLRIVKATGRPAGTVYPILDRLERSGWVESRWEEQDARRGPRRRLYRLTAPGAAEAVRVVTSRAVAAAAPTSAAETARPGTARPDTPGRLA